MPQGNNPAEDKRTTENRINQGSAEQNDAVKKAYDDVQRLKEQIEKLKAQAQALSTEPAESAKKADNGRSVSAAPKDNAAAAKVDSNAATKVDPDAARAAEEAVIRAAKNESKEEQRRVSRPLEERQAIIQDAIKKEQEAKKRLEQKKAEAQRRQQELMAAEQKAAKMSADMRKAEIQSELNRTLYAQNLRREEQRKKREQEKRARVRASLEREKAELQRKEEARLEREQERLARAQATANRKNEAIRLKNEELKARKERDRLQAEQRELLRKQREERLEIKRQRKLARKSAEMGGGIVKVHGTTIQTEIKPVPAFSLKELLGMSKLKEINAAQSEEERQNLLEENERIKKEARATALQLREIRKNRRRNSALYKKGQNFAAACDSRRKPIILGLSILLIVAVGAAGLTNYFTAFEYSYGDKKLGYVKNKDEVLQITEMVQNALTEERDMTVVLDPRNDIKFKRVVTWNKDIVIDSQDGVLQRLSYLGDINVKAYGMYVDGRKVGAVKDKKIAAGVLEGLENKYANHDEGTKLDEAVVVENVEFRKSNTPMNEILTKDQLIEKLCTDTEKETVHTVQRGETLDSIAENHNLTKEQILQSNDNLDEKSLQVGSTLVLKETAPLLTVRMTETRSYEEKTDYKTIKKKDDDLYEGETEVSQEGKKGKSQITEKTVSVNGEVVETETLKKEVEKEPVDKVILVGTKERPPTTGTGTFIWPAYDGTYTVTSEFKWRWGRQHEGIDMGCRTGNDVLAADGGTVIFAGVMSGYGNLVIIDHENGLQTYYAHNSQLLVSRGDKVFQGQHIAEAGNTGHSFGSHIHFGVKDNGSFQNPRNYLPER